MDHMYVFMVIINFLVLEVISGDFTIYVVAFFIFLGFFIYERSNVVNSID